MTTAPVHAERASRSSGMEALARAGIGARAAVYAIVGVLALKVAFGDGGKTTDQQGALKTVAQGPFGKVLLVALAIGLLGYALWRLLRAGLGHGVETGEDDLKDRVDSGVSGVAYGLLFVTAVSLLAGSGGGGGGGPKSTTAGVLDWPAGRWLVGIAGVVIVGVGIQQAVKGLKRDFCEDAKTGEMSARMRTVYEAFGVGGHLARAVVFALIGVFVVKAAVEYDPQEAIGLDGALAKVASSDGGPVLLALVAIGLLCFAAYAALDTRYRRV